MNISPAVQARMNELREKEAAAKAQEEFLKQELIKGIATEVSLKSDDWEAELLFEIEKTPRFTTWLREKINTAKDPTKNVQRIIWHTPDGKQPFYRSGYHDMSDGKRKIIAIPHYNIHETAETIIAGIPVPAEYTLENERMRIRYRVLTTVIDSVKATLKEEALAEEKRLAEVARIAAEEKAAAARAQEARRLAAFDKYSKKLLASIQTPWHTFTGIDPSGLLMYVMYDESLKQLRMYKSGHNINADAVVTVVTGVSHPLPSSMKAPVEWNDMFEKGRLPFLTCCPVCSAQVTFEGITPNGQIYYVRCENHYSWDPVKNQNYKYKYFPRKGPSFSHHILYHPEAWDPRDPDGSKAARAARDKKIAETEAEIASLQAKLEALKKA